MIFTKVKKKKKKKLVFFFFFFFFFFFYYYYPAALSAPYYAITHVCGDYSNQQSPGQKQPRQQLAKKEKVGRTRSSEDFLTFEKERERSK